MKIQSFLPAATLVLGISIGWVAKPAARSSAENPAAKPAPSQAAASRRDSAPLKERVSSGRPLAEVKASDYPPISSPAVKSRDGAKMFRLAEALGLDEAQQAALLQIIEESQRSAGESDVTLVQFIARANALDDAIRKLLTPEQLLKFEELRERDRENRLEARVQRNLNRVAESIDLSPGQKEEALARLRQSVKAEFQAIPAAATLLLDTSVLPVGNKELTADGLLQLSKLGESNPNENPGDVIQQSIVRQRQEIEDQGKVFDGILTPGQQEQYDAAVAESKAMLDKLQAVDTSSTRKRHDPF